MSFAPVSCSFFQKVCSKISKSAILGWKAALSVIAYAMPPCPPSVACATSPSGRRESFKGRGNCGSRSVGAESRPLSQNLTVLPAPPKGGANCGSRLAGAESGRCVGSPFGSNGDDHRLRRKQGEAVGAAASKTRVPPKARSGCWVPRPGAGSAQAMTERATSIIGGKEYESVYYGHWS